MYLSLEFNINLVKIGQTMIKIDLQNYVFLTRIQY